jgi:hypothetical protein
LFASTTGYQVHAFNQAASDLGIDLQLATDRCDHLDDPWRDRAIPVRFHDVDGGVATIQKAGAFDGVLAVGDRPAPLAARAAQALGVPWHTPQGASASRCKQGTRLRLQERGMPVPDFAVASTESDLVSWFDRLPVVVKPTRLSGSRGVIRANTPHELREAWARIGRLLARRDVRAAREAEGRTILVESFIPGREYAIEGLLTHGRLQVLAIFDKPDPLYGPYFEETIYITPSRASRPVQRAIESSVDDACRALGLHHGPIHAECRINEQGVYILEVAARPIGGICARALRFIAPDGGTSSLEALLLRHAVGQRVGVWRREAAASGVMMIPIPGAGVFRGVDDVDRARAVGGIDDVVITARLDQLLLPLPEGSTYLGFMFAHGASATEVERALRAANACLHVRMDRAVPVVS